MSDSNLLRVWWLVAGVVCCAQASAQHRTATYTVSIRGPCGQTIEARPGTVYDDGTGGLPDFERGRPGHAWDVVISRLTPPNVETGKLLQWRWAVGTEGPLEITDITTNGTVSCRGPPPCEGGGSLIVLNELTGPPDGEGPQTEENRGALSWVMLGFEEPGLDDGTYVVGKIRVAADFPDSLGETVAGRVFFATRTGSIDFPVSPTVLQGLADPVPDEFVTLEDCEILLRAATPFIRCDVNDSGRLEISDAIWILGELFLGNRETACPAARDCDADGEWRITDAVYALTHLFLGGLPPPAPFPECGFGGGVPNDCAAGSTRCQ